MKRIQSYVIDIDIPIPKSEEELALSGSMPLLLDAAREVKQAINEYVDLVSPFNSETQDVLPSYTHPTEITIDKNPLYPFVVDDEIIALQDSMPFESSLEQQSIYNGDINVEIAPYLVALDGDLSNPDTWALDQSVATEVLKFAKNPPQSVNDVDNPEGGSSFLDFIKKINLAEEKMKRAKLMHKGLLEKIVSAQSNPMASKVMGFFNRNSQIGAMAALKQKIAIKDIFLKGSPTSGWMDKLKSIKTAIPLTKMPTLPSLPAALEKMKK